MKRNFDQMSTSEVKPCSHECASCALLRSGVILDPPRKDPKAHQWCFVLNNYTEADLASLVSRASREKYIFGREICPSTQTPHIQGYIKFRQLMRFSTLKNWDSRIHWTKCTGGKNAMAIQYNNLIYCSKDRNYVSNCYIPEPLKTLTQEELYPWQRALEARLVQQPDDRKIIWIYDTIGKTGKTAFIKYMANKYEWVEWCAATKSADIVTMANPLKCCYLLNFTRSQESYEPWSALEQLKDGMISDAKLKKECRNVLMNPPWVVCFANWPPMQTKMSTDRWDIIDIGM